MLGSVPQTDIGGVDELCYHSPMEHPYDLYYWPTIQGRGEFVRLALEAAGVKYRDIGRTKGISALTDMCGAFGDAKTAKGGYIPFAPPVLKAGDQTIFQTALICAWIGERHGLVPRDKQSRQFGLGLALTIEDFARETHDTHHPIAAYLYYEDQKKEAKRRAKDFRENRLATYLSYFEAIISANEKSDVWLIGSKLSYCDLSLFQMVEGLTYAFPKAMKRVSAGCPQVLALANAVSETPSIRRYLKSKRRIPFNEEGLFRHYPELDDT